MCITQSYFAGNKGLKAQNATKKIRDCIDFLKNISQQGNLSQ